MKKLLPLILTSFGCAKDQYMVPPPGGDMIVSSSFTFIGSIWFWIIAYFVIGFIIATLAVKYNKISPADSDPDTEFITAFLLWPIYLLTLIIQWWVKLIRK